MDTLNLDENSNIMQEIKNHPIFAFIMETPHDFIDVEFVKNYNIEKIYKVAKSKNCDFWHVIVDLHLKDKFPECAAGFYLKHDTESYKW